MNNNETELDIINKIKQTKDLSLLKKEEERTGNTNILNKIAENVNSDLEVLTNIFNKTKKKFVLVSVYHNPNADDNLKNNIKNFLGEYLTIKETTEENMNKNETELETTEENMNNNNKIDIETTESVKKISKKKRYYN